MRAQASACIATSAVVASIGCTREVYIAPAAATAEHMGAGLGVRSASGVTWLAVNSVAHVATERTLGDSTWRVVAGHLELCTASERGPICRTVDSAGVSPDTLLFVADDAKWLRAKRRRELAAETEAAVVAKPAAPPADAPDASEAAKPAAPPSDAPAPRASVEPRDAHVANAVWVRGVPGSVLTAGVGLVAYCVAEPEPRCVPVKFPVDNGFVKAVLSVHRLRQPEPTDVVWLGLGDSVSTFWWGAASTAFTVVRCAASPQRPEPVCRVVEP